MKELISIGAPTGNLYDPTKRHPTKRMEEGETFWILEHQCKVTYIGAKEYYYVHLDCERQGVLPFDLFHTEFKHCRRNGYYKGMNPFYTLRDRAMDKAKTLGSS